MVDSLVHLAQPQMEGRNDALYWLQNTSEKK